MYWADITLDYSDKAGRIQIASDYGNWQNYWGACGSSFKEFLTKLDIYYAAGKFGADGWFDLDATLSSMRNDIKEAVKNKELSKAESKELLEEVESLEQCSSVHEYYDMVYRDSDKLTTFFDAADFPCKKDVTPQFKRFWNEAWTVFINQIKEELK
ncbi:hypothetical protein G7050_16020 [Dysgonomonas sp. HDW5A]|uniref:hypothetical protein n=1 Tax=Dysgonomonas sp. HDW5A TaxID=2714926 RepID=UPI001408C7B4|nr:hypothetical protein [Dysgonomonas sp. HDW5A]QIK61261.1 hypothetical protein G7050_16020 [Dysgonomonas sp. HDW5A]